MLGMNHVESSTTGGWSLSSNLRSSAGVTSNGVDDTELDMTRRDALKLESRQTERGEANARENSMP